MKKYICTALALLMAASLFVGCGCTNRNVSTNPNGKVTEPTTVAPTNPIPTMTTPYEETTHPTETHRETTSPTHETTGHTGPTEHNGTTGPITDSTEGTHSDNSRARGVWPDRHS